MKLFVTVEQANIIKYSWQIGVGPRRPWGPEIWPTSKVMPDYYFSNQVIHVECLTFYHTNSKIATKISQTHERENTIFVHSMQTEKVHPYDAFSRWPNTGSRHQRNRRRRRSIGIRTGNWVGQASPDKRVMVFNIRPGVAWAAWHTALSLSKIMVHQERTFNREKKS